jgi:hypothetical protein
MGTELKISMRMQNRVPVRQSFVRLVRALASAPVKLDCWGSVSWYNHEKASCRRVELLKTGCAPEEIAATIEHSTELNNTIDMMRGELSTDATWLLNTGATSLCLNAWTLGIYTRPVELLDGHIEVWLPRIGSFMEPANQAKDSHLIEENLELLIQLLVALIDSLAPATLSVFAGDGMHHPLNANAIWFPNHNAILEQLAFIALLSHEGCPDWKLAPLALPECANDRWAFHEWRNEMQRHHLWQRLSSNIGKYSSVTNDTIDQVLATHKFDVYHIGEGLLLFNYPYLVNGFVDDFFLTLLETTLSS